MKLDASAHSTGQIVVRPLSRPRCPKSLLLLEKRLLNYRVSLIVAENRAACCSGWHRRHWASFSVSEMKAVWPFEILLVATGHRRQIDDFSSPGKDSLAQF